MADGTLRLSAIFSPVELCAERRAARRRAHRLRGRDRSGDGRQPVRAAVAAGRAGGRRGRPRGAAWWLAIEHRAASPPTPELLDDLIIHGWVNVAPGRRARARVRAALDAAPPTCSRGRSRTSCSRRPCSPTSASPCCSSCAASATACAPRPPAAHDEVDARGVVMIEQLLTDGTEPHPRGPSDGDRSGAGARRARARPRRSRRGSAQRQPPRPGAGSRPRAARCSAR